MGISQIDFYKFSIVIVLFSIAVQDQSNPPDTVSQSVHQLNTTTTTQSQSYKHGQLLATEAYLT